MKGKRVGDNHQDYVIKDGKFIGKFDEMYKACNDPWSQDDLDAPHNLHKKLSISLLKYLGVKPTKILDIGSGKGKFTAYLHMNLASKETYAIDISPTAIEIATKCFPDINFIVCEHIKMKDIIPLHYFDLIVISELFWYILPSINDFIRKLRLFLKDESSIVMVIQHFYQKGEQKYGKGIMKNYQDLINIFKKNNFLVLYSFEANRHKNYDTVTFFR